MNTFRLSLGYNRIQTIDRDAFESLAPTIQYLNLDNNRLEHIPWNAISNLTSLVHLYVGSNLIQDDGVNPPQGLCTGYLIPSNPIIAFVW
jgi:Leucine-rich repeat (LRR) protein